MKKTTAWRTARPLCLAVILLLLVFFLLLQAISGSSQCQVDVRITGRLLDEDGRPVTDEEILFTFYVSPEKKDQEERIQTGQQGEFLLEASVPQSSYLNAGRQCVEIQGRVFLPDSVEAVGYRQGAPAVMSKSSAYESWTPEGRYEGNTIRLFHSIRGGAGAEGEIFADMTVVLGSEEEPVILQIEGKGPPDQTELRISHKEAGSGKAIFETEVYIYNTDDLPGQVVRPREVEGMAPVTVATGDRLVAEAQRGSPITAVNAEELRTGSSWPDLIETTIYYHMDRDGDGVPDYEIAEQYLTEAGHAVPGQPVQSRVYAHKDSYIAQLPSLSGYAYKGYKHDEEALKEGVPREIVTADGRYQFIYEKRETTKPPSGGGSGNEEDSKPPEGAEGESPDEEGAGESKNPEEPKPPVEPEPGEHLEPEPESPGEAGGEAEDGDNAHESGASRPASPLTEEEREQLRNITFVKYSYQQDVKPGEEVSYGFRGFQNNFPYPLQEFTVVDQPNPGLDLVSIQLPAFSEGGGVTYDISCITDRQNEKTLVNGQPADVPLTVRAPALSANEHITDITILFGEAPSGFGKDDEIRITFRVWDDPPEDDLHNTGLLYYEEQGKRIEKKSDDYSSLTENGGTRGKKRVEQQRLTAQQRFPEKEKREKDGFIHGGKNSLSRALIFTGLALALCGAAATEWKRKRKT